MATYRFLAPQKLHKERFDKLVHVLLNEKVEGGVSKALARKLVMAGAAYLAGSRCRIASKPVWAGTEVRVEYDAARVHRPVNPGTVLERSCVLYEKHGIIIVDKPAGLPTVPTLDDARHNLVAGLEKLLGRKLGIHHRLDAQTSGCLLFTTDPARNAFVSRLFQEHLVKKEYLAIVTLNGRTPPKTWEIRNQLVRVAKKKNRYASTPLSTGASTALSTGASARLSTGASTDSGTGASAVPNDTANPAVEGSFAYSRFELLDMRQNLALVRCVPVTGRTHQLRVHLSEYGLPILGDRLYGGATADRLMLHARSLEFREDDASMVLVEAPIPEAFKTLFDL